MVNQTGNPEGQLRQDTPFLLVKPIIALLLDIFGFKFNKKKIYYYNKNPGKDAWANSFPICKDDTPTSRQSPIDIKSSRAVYDLALKPLKMVKYDTANSNKMVLFNNGHTISVGMKEGSSFESMVEHKGIIHNSNTLCNRLYRYIKYFCDELWQLTGQYYVIIFPLKDSILYRMKKGYQEMR